MKKGQREILLVSWLMEVDFPGFTRLGNHARLRMAMENNKWIGVGLLLNVDVEYLFT